MATNFKDDTTRAAPLLAHFLATIRPDRDRLSHARQILFSRVSHPASLFDGETYDVDTNKAWFEGRFEGESVSEGPLEVVGTYLLPQGSWLWSWRNPSVPSQAAAEIRGFVEGASELDGLRDCELFQCGPDEAEQLATWIAVRAGFLGAYPAPFGDAFVYLALKLNKVGAASFEPKDAIWCAMCGRWPTQVKVLIRGMSGYGCDGCFEQTREIMDFDESGEKYRPTAPGAPPVNELMPACICCNEHPPRVFFPYSALCVNCVRQAREAGH